MTDHIYIYIYIYTCIKLTIEHSTTCDSRINLNYIYIYILNHNIKNTTQSYGLSSHNSNDFVQIVNTSSTEYSLIHDQVALDIQ